MNKPPLVPQLPPLLTVTRETVAPPKDAAQGSSGEVVASAKLGPCPA